LAAKARGSTTSIRYPSGSLVSNPSVMRRPARGRRSLPG
jgi:hypothetical protein